MIVFNGDARMSSLNYKFKGKNKPTDVLAFNLAEKGANDYIEGEVYVNLQIARRQADDYGVGYLEEVSRLCVHGFLHLLGYDDKKASAKTKLWAVQERYLRRFFKKEY